MIENAKATFRIGPIRPPSESNSLLLQVTEGCTWNKCKFCDLYRHSSFRIFSVESIKKDIDIIAHYADLILKHKNRDGIWDRRGIKQEMEILAEEERSSFYVVYNWLIHGGENVFLQDGNSLALKADRVEEVILYLRSKFPNIKRVTTYARAETLSKITLEQFKSLKEAGLDRIHSGFESGSDKVLDLINKGVTSEQEIIAGKNIKKAGIEFSIYFMPGIGGKALSRENALETARVLTEINPDYVRIRTAVIKNGTELWDAYQRREFLICSDNEKLMEIRLLIENAKGCTGSLVSDHMINLMQEITGKLDVDKETMLSSIDEYFALPELNQKMYQLARRFGMVSKLEDMENLSTSQSRELENICDSVNTDADWDMMINEIMMKYI